MKQKNSNMYFASLLLSDLEQRATSMSHSASEVSLGVKTFFIKRSQMLRPTIKRTIHQRRSCHDMRGMVGDFFGNASQKMTHAFFQIFWCSSLTPPPPSSGSSHQWKKQSEADCCSLTRVSTQKLRQTCKCSSAGMPKCSQENTKNPQTTCMQTYLIKKKCEGKKINTHIFALLQ